MSFKGLRFLFIVLNVNVFCISGKQSRSGVRCHWEKFQFSFMEELEYQFPNETVFCNMAHECFSDHPENNETYKKNEINFTFPVISNSRLFKQGLPTPMLFIKEVYSGKLREILSSLVKIWKLLVFCIMAAVTSGIIIWFLVSIMDHQCVGVFELVLTNWVWTKNKLPV